MVTNGCSISIYIYFHENWWNSFQVVTWLFDFHELKDRPFFSMQKVEADAVGEALVELRPAGKRDYFFRRKRWPNGKNSGKLLDLSSLVLFFHDLAIEQIILKHGCNFW